MNSVKFSKSQQTRLEEFFTGLNVLEQKNISFFQHKICSTFFPNQTFIEAFCPAGKFHVDRNLLVTPQHKNEKSKKEKNMNRNLTCLERSQQHKSLKLMNSTHKMESRDAVFSNSSLLFKSQP